MKLTNIEKNGAAVVMVREATTTDVSSALLSRAVTKLF